MVYRKRRSHEEWKKEEERCSEQSRLRGLRYTLASFVLSFLALAAAKITHPEWSLGSLFFILGGLALGTLLMIFTIRGKRRS